MKTFNHTDSVTVETQQPARPADFRSDVLVPLAQSVLTGVLLSGLVAFLVWRQSWDGDLGVLFLGLALTVSCLAWVVLLAQHRRLLWAAEKLTRVDLNGDKTVGDPRDRLLVLNASQGKAQQVRRENEARRADFVDFVSRLPHKGTSLRAWESELGRDSYAEFRDALLKLGWARWRSHDQRKGWALTMPIDDILKRVSGE